MSYSEATKEGESTTGESKKGFTGARLLNLVL